MMQGWIKKGLRAAVAALGIGALSIGCAQERAPINRVQANALDKSFFVGKDLHDPSDDPEFWTQGTLIDVGYGAEQDGLFTSTYAQAVARIKWQITEDLLIARLTYERIANSDGKGAGAASTDGQVVAAYKILKHFDIINDYNPSTGEEYNVVVENDTDRPWYERQYFRIDWSQNLNTDAYDYDTLARLSAFDYGQIKYTTLAYYVNDPYDDDQPYFDIAGGYFDVTTKAFAEPGMLDLGIFGEALGIKIPTCFLPMQEIGGGTAPVGNCNPVELTIRTAYRKVVDSDYEPLDWDGNRFVAYGAFTTDRYGFTREYGMTDEQWHRFIDRYNIWERSHYYDDPDNLQGKVACFTQQTLAFGEDPHYDGPGVLPGSSQQKSAPDGTENRCWMVTVKLATQNGDCTPGEDPGKCYADLSYKYGGSKCDTFRQACTLPFRFRKQKPLAWYYTTGSNPEWYEGTEWAAHDHDVAMRGAIMAARYAECMTTNQKLGAGAKDFCLTGKQGGKQFAQPNPMYFGQMDDDLEAKQLAEEVDDCRHGLSHPEYGDVNSDSREQQCVALADPSNPNSVFNQRAAAGGTNDKGVGYLAMMPEQVVLCHSPVEANDPIACAPPDRRLPPGQTAAACFAAKQAGDEATYQACLHDPDTGVERINVRRGDIRYHNVNVLTEPQVPSPWGIMVDARDPLTGENISASVNVWSYVNDLWGQLVMDRIRYIKGELSIDQITEATFVDDWAKADAAANGGGVAGHVTRGEVDNRVAAFAHIPRAQLAQIRANPNGQYLAAGLQAMQAASDARMSINAPATHPAQWEAAAAALRDSDAETELLSEPILQLGGLSNGASVDGTTLNTISPLRGGSPHLVSEMNNFMQEAYAERGVCIMNQAPVPMAITGLADILERKFKNACAASGPNGCLYTYGTFGSTPPNLPASVAPADFQRTRANAMRNYLEQRAEYAVIVHEMGHSVGERHNFVSSSDAFSYRPQYWQLRTDNGSNTTECTDYTPDGSTCVGPRWFDPLTKQEKDNLIWMWMQSSVMDYAGEYTQDMLGLGAYDFAAHRMFYGQTVAVYSDPSYQVGSTRSQWLLDAFQGKMDNFGGLIGYQPFYGHSLQGGQNLPNFIHYSQLQKDYALIQNCKPVDPSKWQPAGWDVGKHGTWDSLLDGLIVTVNGQPTKCRQQPVDYVQWQSLRVATPAEQGLSGSAAAAFSRQAQSIDPRGRIRVPYGFATDTWADLGNAAVYRHDNGADNYEIYDFLITQQEIQHIFDDYRRSRTTFSLLSASNRTLERYNEKIQRGAKGLSLEYTFIKDYAHQANLPFSQVWAATAGQFWPDQILASADVFDHFTRMFSRPEPGWHIPQAVDPAASSRVLLSTQDSPSLNEDYCTKGGAGCMTVADGASLGYFDTVTYNGKPLENRFDFSKGEYFPDYNVNVGAYYDKTWVPYLMGESADYFISSTRVDFEDARYRAVSLADIFPDGFRRWLANNLTGDIVAKGWQVAADANGNPLVNQVMSGNTVATAFPRQPLGFVQWWPDQTRLCFPSGGTTLCDAPYSQSPLSFGSQLPANTVTLDPEIGWEQQKWLIAYTYRYLIPNFHESTNEKVSWANMLKLWELGSDADPGVANRIEYHDPTGRVYIAETFGKETLTHVQPSFCTPFDQGCPPTTVQKGIAARVLEWANYLVKNAYVTKDGPDVDGDGRPDWYLPVLVDGQPIVQPCPPDGTNNTCQCSDNWYCEELSRFNSVPWYLHLTRIRWEKKGVY